MAFTADPLNSVTDRVRLLTGDTDSYDEGYPDEVYQYVLEKHDLDETKAGVEILRMLVAKYANYVTEKAGGLFSKESEKFTQYKSLLDLLTKDPRSAIIKAGVGFTGGVSKTSRDQLRNSSDVRQNPLRTQNTSNDTKYSNQSFYFWQGSNQDD